MTTTVGPKSSIGSPAAKWIVCLALLSASAAGNANGVMTRGTPADLVPIETEHVRMVSEDIVMNATGNLCPEEPGEKLWDVTAEYVFENLSAREVKGAFGFPEYACEERAESIAEGVDPMCDERPLKYEDMRTTLDGVLLPNRKGHISAKHPWAPALGTVWLYDVRFPPKKRVKITHHYRMRQTETTVGAMQSAYVTRTGALWAGSIGSARFRIHLPLTTRTIELFELEQTGLSLTKQVVEENGKQVGELLLEATDWNPTRDIEFSYHACPGRNWETTNIVEAFFERQKSEVVPPTEKCPHIFDLLSWGAMRLQDKLPVEPSKEDVEKYLALGGNMKICRDFVYAIYGRRFEDDAKNRYFYGRKGWVPGPWPYRHLSPNPAYSEAMLTEADKVSLRLIDAIEKRLAPCAPCTCTGNAQAMEAAKNEEHKNGQGCAMSAMPRPISKGFLSFFFGLFP